ncbi:phage holin family protein [Amycolatopsis sp. FDAARGOS 1241]|uniref:phage holin family protein n=1 Tax=Amycolatopsis sp. FDAARGOS 1241 TaxID=2778070 RepID=UPI001952290C|nr:phage holin family protein [Amycolatopsis sp. FDAARGOS 1241]QRP49547.1 phage holin family protein [Amycolatopsis sp. FDAARGOS 1241]
MIEEVPAKPPEERSFGELVSDLTEQIKRLVRDEVRLAVFEVRKKSTRMGVGAGLFGAAGLVALFGGGAVVAAAIMALALVLPGWAAALVVAGVLFVLAGLTALVGRTQLKRGSPPMPEEAIEGVREDVEVVRQEVRS